MRSLENAPRSFWDVATVALALGVFAIHISFVAQDTRLPWDPGRYFKHMPVYYWQQMTFAGFFTSFGDALIQSSGWYEWILAAVLHIFGRTAGVFASVGSFWYITILLLTALLARRVSGPAAGFLAVAVMASTPSITLFCRFPWIHIPETGLLLGMLVLYAYDDALKRKSTIIGLALLGVMTIQLRESGIVWVATLVPLMAFGVRREKDAPWPWRRFSWVLFGWGLALIPPLLRMENYVGGKLGARSRYMLQTPPLLEQFAESLSLPVTVIVGVGMAAFLYRLKKSFHPIGLLFIVWALIPILLFLVFYAGFTNYTPFMPAVAVASAWGLVGIHPLLALLGLQVFLLVFQSWWPTPMTLPEITRAGHGGDVDRYQIDKVMQPWQGFGAREVAALLDATCPSNEWHECHVLVDQGLFFPNSEDYGLFGLFLLGEDRVELRGVYDVPEEGWANYRVDAYAHFRCGEYDDHFRRKAPGATVNMLNLMQYKGLQAVWSGRVDGRCSYYWFAPNGAALNPHRLPLVGPYGEAEPWSTALALRDLQEFQQRNPEFAFRQGAASIYTAEVPLMSQRPAVWNQDIGAADRAASIDSLYPWW